MKFYYRKVQCVYVAVDISARVSFACKLHNFEE